MSDLPISTKYYLYPENTKLENMCRIWHTDEIPNYTPQQKMELDYDIKCLASMASNKNCLESIFRLAFQAFCLKEKFETLLEIYDIHNALLKYVSWSAKDANYFQNIIRLFKGQTRYRCGINSSILDEWNTNINKSLIMKSRSEYVFVETERETISEQRIRVREIIFEHPIFKQFFFEIAVKQNMVFYIIILMKDRLLDFVSPFKGLDIATKSLETFGKELPLSVFNENGRLIYDTYIKKMGFNTKTFTNIADFYLKVREIRNSVDLTQVQMNEKFRSIWPTPWCKCEYPTGDVNINDQYERYEKSLINGFENIKNARIINFDNFLTKEIDRRKAIEAINQRRIISKHDVFRYSEFNDSEIESHLNKIIYNCLHINLIMKNVIESKIIELIDLCEWDEILHNKMGRMTFQAFCIAAKNTDHIADTDFKTKLLPLLSTYDVCAETIITTPVGSLWHKGYTRRFRNMIEELDIEQLELTIENSRITQDTMELLKMHERNFTSLIKETKFYEDFLASLHNRTYNIRKIILLIHKTHGDSLTN